MAALIEGKRHACSPWWCAKDLPVSASPVGRAWACAAALFGLGTTLADPARAQLDGSDRFVKDTVAGFNARTFYMDAEDNSKPPASTRKQAWAAGRKLYGRTGYWKAPACSRPARKPSRCGASCTVA